MNNKITAAACIVALIRFIDFHFCALRPFTIALLPLASFYNAFCLIYASATHYDIEFFCCRCSLHCLFLHTTQEVISVTDDPENENPSIVDNKSINSTGILSRSKMKETKQRKYQQQQKKIECTICANLECLCLTSQHRGCSDLSAIYTGTQKKK